LKFLVEEDDGLKSAFYDPRTSLNRTDRDVRDPVLAALGSSAPEPWPVPFPLADAGLIYPCLPPAEQFDQMVRYTSSTEEHIDKWDLHDGTYPVSFLCQVLSAQECVHMGLYSQLEHMDRLLKVLEGKMKPVPAKERAEKGKVGEKHRRITPQMLRSITKQQQIYFYESRIPTRLQ